MNLLFASDVFPYPPHTGSAVISFHWARVLARRHKIHMISALPPEDGTHRQQLEQIGVSAAKITEGYMRPRGLHHAAAWLPIVMHRLRAREFWGEVEREARAHRADAIVVVSAGLGVLLPHRKRVPPIVFVPYDAESLNFAMRARRGRGAIRRAYFGVEALKWQAVEAMYYPLADACVAVTEEDADAISRRWTATFRERIHVIPNGVEVGHFAPWSSQEVAGRILISGNMGSTDTEVSLRWFLHAVLPRIRRRVPQATVEIVGRDPLPSLRRMTGEVVGVALRGYVPDLRPYLAQASVYVAPLRLGSGVKNRVLEALAMGKAVVATPLGVRGLRVEPGRDVLVAATEDTFADAVVELLRDGPRRAQIGKAAREAIIAHHSWDAVGDLVDHVLNVSGSQTARHAEPATGPISPARSVSHSYQDEAPGFESTAHSAGDTSVRL